MSWRATHWHRLGPHVLTAEASPSPHYRHPPRLVLSTVASVLLGKKRAFAADAEELVRNIAPEPHVENARWIPRQGPFMVLTNHYYRPGYQAWWGIALITWGIAKARDRWEQITWLMTNRWTYPDRLRSCLVTPLTHLLLTRLAHIYGFVSMPPMPPQPRYMQEGARGVRQTLSLLDSLATDDKPIIGFAPEGRDSPDGSLIEPPSGTGRFLLHLSSRGLPLLPVGVAEIDGVLTARFGPPFVLAAANIHADRGLKPELSKKELDLCASAQVMTAIGAQLPPALWGAFRAQIEQAVGESQCL